MAETKEDLKTLEDFDNNTNNTSKELSNDELAKVSGGTYVPSPMHKPIREKGLSTGTNQGEEDATPKGKAAGKVSYSFDSYDELGVPYNPQYQTGSNHPVIAWDLNGCNFKMTNCCSCSEYQKVTTLGYCSARSEENDPSIC